MIMVNGNTWPFLTVEQRRYRFRFLNGCQSRFLILDFSNIPGVEVWQIGNEGGFLAAPVNLTADHGNRLLMGLAERADVIVDFTNVPVGNYVLGNVGPDEPFGGGDPRRRLRRRPIPSTTGQVMQFRVVPAVGADPTTPPQFLVLPAITPLPAATVTRPLALLEEVSTFFDERRPRRCSAPSTAIRNTVAGAWTSACGWTRSPRTRRSARPRCGSSTTPPPTPTRCTSTRCLRGRQPAGDRARRGRPRSRPGRSSSTATSRPGAWETGFKDTVIAYPGEVTRVRAQFNTPGQFVWHCHIVEHEDNEMMRPYRIGPVQPGQPELTCKRLPSCCGESSASR